jgi:sporulation protein YlmC with PRC-barrel domain
MRKTLFATAAALALLGGAAAAETTSNTITTLPADTNSIIGKTITDASGTVVGVVSDVQLNDDRTLQGVIIKDTTGSFVAPPGRIIWNTDGTLRLNATAEEIRLMPVFGGDAVGEGKGGENSSGENAN